MATRTPAVGPTQTQSLSRRGLPAQRLARRPGSIPPPQRVAAQARNEQIARQPVRQPQRPEVPQLAVLERKLTLLADELGGVDGTVMLGPGDLETFLGDGTLALSAKDLHTLHTRGLTFAEVLAAARAHSQRLEAESVDQSAARFDDTGSLEPVRPRGVGGAWAKARELARGLFSRGGSRDESVEGAPDAAASPEVARREPTDELAAALPAGSVVRAASDDDHAELRLLACDLQAHLDGLGKGVSPRVIVRDGKVVGVLIDP